MKLNHAVKHLIKNFFNGNTGSGSAFRNVFIPETQ